MPPAALTRPSDLPDYGAPPVSEVVLGVQFNSLDRLMTPHFGLIWEQFRDRFGIVEEHPPLDPVFETFPEKGTAAVAGAFNIQMMTSVPTPRVFFLSGDRSELLQVQRDRFIHNWRKTEAADHYPRYERLAETFSTCYREFDALMKREKVGQIVANQCEIIYVNQIPLLQGETTVAAFERIFGRLTVTVDLEDVGKPEDARFMIRYVMRDRDKAAIGRLMVSAEPAMQADGTNVVQLTLVARGRPMSADANGIIEFFDAGRRLIVRSFTNLTSKKMHQEWGRRQ
jgi:uncharacterized protein (TIGR04255 family)